MEINIYKIKTSYLLGFFTANMPDRYILQKRAFLNKRVPFFAEQKCNKKKELQVVMAQE